ncbi:hypothetical protein HH308_11830 [Gordonia sp. TBRC 11910]|uniref:Bacteriocin biosynthesis cyclodehydratase domain-containing protein n=1 Tax=Gordonia asplenii TaxID=2725283 RepID=A0A848KUJ8_9ACTN|nr:hypothetical protein [Gordonia asplenii]NMO01899.1 hypothetical protein [Gordonia asplenii]
MTTAAAQPPVVRPGATILVRRPDRIQLGCDPEHATILDLTPPATAESMVAVLRFLSVPRTHPEVSRYLRSIGLSRNDFEVLVEQLEACDALLPTSGARRISELRVRVHGRGPIADRLTDSLSDSGLRIMNSVRAPRMPWTDTQVAILTDYHAHDPMVIKLLMRQRIPHLAVRLRDGVGIVGPLVLPGLSSCLRCADHYRATLDPQWPTVAAQLLGKPGYASGATIRATVALAHEQIEQIANRLSTSGEPDVAAPPDLVDHTLEFHVNPVRLRRKHWPAHPSCGCSPAG